jgi:hypothetical protein
MSQWKKVTGASIMGQPPLPPRAGPSPAKVMAGDHDSMQSAGMPGNEESDPPRKRL